MWRREHQRKRKAAEEADQRSEDRANARRENARRADSRSREQSEKARAFAEFRHRAQEANRKAEQRAAGITSTKPPNSPGGRSSQSKAGQSEALENPKTMISELRRRLGR